MKLFNKLLRYIFGEPEISHVAESHEKADNITDDVPEFEKVFEEKIKQLAENHKPIVYEVVKREGKGHISVRQKVLK